MRVNGILSFLSFCDVCSDDCRSNCWAEFAFVSVNSIFGQMLLFYEGFIVLVSHPDTNPFRKRLTSVNFSITKPSDAQRAHLW